MKETSSPEPSDQQANSNQSRADKIFFAVFFGLIFTVVLITFVKYFIWRDYIIQAGADCDPAEEKCFIWECDPQAADKSEQCTGDPEKDIWYYKLVRKNAGLIPDCDPENEECGALSCEGIDEKNCEEILCDADTKEEEGVECNDPEEYLLNNPAEESEECEEGDEECLSEESEEGIAEEECVPEDEECLNEEEEGSQGLEVEESEVSI